MKNGKTIIGITGNIATGKSVVRRMLANAGALGLDADVIAHRMLYPQGPSYSDVVSAFGEEILTINGEISRLRLGEIAFQDPELLAQLESIVHPAVSRAIQTRISQAQTPIIALEAIKLLEAGLGEICDATWVSLAPRETQLERLLQTRGLTEAAALARIEAQPPQDEKRIRADVVIDTHGTFKRTWSQIQAALNDTIQVGEQPLPYSQGWAAPSIGKASIDGFLGFWDENTDDPGESLYAALGTGMIQPLTRDGRLAALLVWENWNFTASLARVLPARILQADLPVFLEAFTAAAQRQGCELLLLPYEWAGHAGLNPGAFGFEKCHAADLAYPAWRTALQSLAPGSWAWAKIIAQPLEVVRGYQLK